MSLTAEPQTAPVESDATLWSKRTTLAAWGILLLGAILRIARFWHFRSLWFDEIYLAGSITTRNLHDLIFKPLDYSQTAPIGYLICGKASTMMLGNGERALRLPALLFSLATLPLFYFLIRPILKAPVALIAIALFAVLGPLIYYAGEVKQYSTEVAVALAIMLAAMRWHRRRDTKSAIILAAVGGAGVFFSFSSIFILTGTGCALLLAPQIKGDTTLYIKGRVPSNLLAIVGGGSVWAIAFALNYFVFIRIQHNAAVAARLQQYWVDREAFLPKSPGKAAHWLMERLSVIARDPGAMRLDFPDLAAFAIVVGMILLSKSHRMFVGVLILPLGVTMLASALQIYPLADRLVLFLVPAFLICIAVGIGSMLQSPTARIAGWLALSILLAPSLARAGYYLLKPPGKEESLQAYQWIASQWKTGDAIYLPQSTAISYDYYHRRAGLPDDPQTTIVDRQAPEEKAAFQACEDRLAGHKRVWLVLIHVLDRNLNDVSDVIKNMADQIGKPVPGEHHNLPGAEIILYDFSK